MRFNWLKQMIICIIIVFMCGILAIFLKEIFLESDKGKIIHQSESKEKFEYNEYSTVNVTTEMLIQRYFGDFKRKLLNFPKEAYDSLDNDTVEYFKSYDKFIDYINENRNEIKKSYIVKYFYHSKSNSKNYIVIDQYDNKYTFSASAVLVYKVKIEFYSKIPSILG